MSDNPTPPKKVGSLRDRIAAFEKPQASSSTPTPPPPRPKPGGLVGQWKPKQLDRVAPSTEDSDTDKGGMSAGDARHSISRVGGLKERMAALQGKGGFGASVDPNTSKAPPLPSEQGKARVWRTVVDVPITATHDEYDNDATAVPSSDDAAKEENVDGGNEPKTEEDLERERRAAIAARMAKLGGARVGMGPPIFGKKPAVPPKPKFPAKDEEKAAEDAPAAELIPTETVMAPPIPAPKRGDTLEKASRIPLPTTGDDAEATPEGQDKPATPSLTVPIPEEGRQRTISSSQRSPNSMPAPAIPRRAAPPRRKQAPPPPPPEPESEPALPEPAAVELLASASDAPASEVTEMDTDAIPEAVTAVPSVEKDEAVPTEETEPILEAATSPPASTSPSASPSDQAENSSPHAHGAAIKVEPPTPYVSAFANAQTTAGGQEETEVEAELDQQGPEDKEEEEDEESPEERRKRIAEKLKEMGAVDRFAGMLEEPAQPETTAAESDKMDADAQKAVPTDQNSQHVHGHHDEDGSEVDYPGGSVASPTSPTRTAPFPPLSMSVPPPPPRPPVEVEKEYGGKDHYKVPGEFTEEEGEVSSAADVDGDDEIKGDVQVLLASRQWAEDGGGEGEDSSIYPLRAATFTPDDSALATPGTPGRLPPPVPSASRPPLSVAVHSEKKSRPLSMNRHNRPLPPPPAPPPIMAPPAPPQEQSVKQTVEDDEEDDESDEPQSLTAALNAALARRPPVPRTSFDAESATQVSPDSPAPAISRSPPPPPVPVRGGSIPQPTSRAIDDSDDEELNYTDEEPSPLPPPVPARTRSPPPVPAGIMSPIMVNTPPPTVPQRIIVPDTPVEELEEQKVKMGIKKPVLPPPMWDEFTPESSKVIREKKSKEVMGDEDTDPIDPNFVLQNNSSPTTPQEEVNQPPQEQEEDPETVRKRTIAERMAKLGGIRFGAPMPSVKTASPRPAAEETEDQSRDAATSSAQTDDVAYPAAEGPDDEDETARRRRIAAKVAAMGGRGLGMGMFGIAPPPAPVYAPKEEDVKPKHELASPPPVPTARPPPRPPIPAANRPPPPPPGPQELEGEIEIVEAHEETEDEGEEIHEIHAGDITEDEEPEMVEVPPPPPPPRSGRPPVPRGSLPPPPASVSHDSESASPPPLPGGRRASVQPPVRTTASIPAPISNTVKLKSQSPPRAPVSPFGAPPSPPPPPPPPPPPSANVVAPAVMYSQHSRPTRTVPAPIPPIESAESSKQQQQPWELPNIPSGSFDLGSRPEESMQMSWTEVGGPSSLGRTELHTYPPGSSSNYAPFAGLTPTALGPEALAALAQRLNPRIVDSAQAIYEKSKKNVIGDGSSLGFLQQVLSTVPTASTESLGHVIYAQTGTSVTRRAGDIVPGDVIALYDAKMKGHKGFAGYSIVVGSAEEPLLGIVSDFNASGKRVKVKVFAVNQLPNAYPTIDTPSYRLDDLKSGTIKVFRIAEI